MRLRPNRGEGERSKQLKKKAPQIALTVLLFSTPLCMAQSAMAMNESVSALGLPVQRQLQREAQAGLPLQAGSFQGRILQTKLSSQTPNLITEADVSAAESILSNYQEKLANLTSQSPLDPANKETLDQKVMVLEGQIRVLEGKVRQLRQELVAYQTAAETLAKIVTRYNQAVSSRTATEERLRLLNVDYTLAQQNLDQATSNAANALAALNSATSARVQAEQVSSGATSELNVRTIAANKASLKLEQSKAKTETARLILTTAQQNLQEANTYLSDTLSRKGVSLEELTSAQQALSAKQLEVSTARSNYDNVVVRYNQLLDTYNTVYGEYLAAQANAQETQQNLNQKQAILQQRQSDYDTYLIQDPAWSPLTYEQAHTRLVPTMTLVPRTVTTLTGGLTADVFNRQGYNNAPPLPTQNERPIRTVTVPDVNFNWGGGEVLGSGRSEDVIVRFTGNISFPTSGSYQFYSPADDGTILQIDGVQIISDWRDKGGGGSTSAPIYLEGGSTHSITLYYYENGGGANVWLYYYTPQTGYQLVPAAYLGTTATTETVYEEVTTYVEETYYTTEIVPGQVTPFINDPSLLPALQLAQQEYDQATQTAQEATQAWTVAQANQQQAAQDSQTGYYNVIDTAGVLNALSAEVDPLSQVVSENQQAYNTLTDEHSGATIAANTAQDNVDAATSSLSSAVDDEATAQSENEQAAFSLATARQDKAIADTSLAMAVNDEKAATTEVESRQSELAATTQTTNNIKTNVDSVSVELVSAQGLEQTALLDKSAAETSLSTSTLTLASSYDAVDTTGIPQAFEEAQATIDIPAPEPEGSPDIPEDLSADNLMEIDLAQVDPTELTEAQAEQLVVAALETFETAEEGSAEYEQALDALLLAAQQDDIVVDETLASIPGVGEAAKAVVAIFNLVGNVGADISPKARKKAQTLVVTTLVVGQIAQTAAMASASSSGSFRRKQ